MHCIAELYEVQAQVAYCQFCDFNVVLNVSEVEVVHSL